MMFTFEADFSGSGTQQPGVVGISTSASIRRVTVAYGKHQQARQMSFRVDDIPTFLEATEQTLCRIAITQALQRPGGFYGEGQLDQPEADLNARMPQWQGALRPAARTGVSPQDQPS